MFASVRPTITLSFNDRNFCQSYCRKNFRFHGAPDWVFDDKQVRRIVAAQVAILARVTFIPKDLTMLRLLNRRAIKLLKKSPSHEWHSLARAAQRKGLPAYLASIIYKTFRVGYDSVQCGADLGVSPTVIRQAILRMKNTATRLDRDRVRWRFRVATAKRKGPYIPRKYARSFDWDKALEMHRAGMSPRDISAGISIGRRAIIRALAKMKEQGLVEIKV
jgi:hypothetical protein